MRQRLVETYTGVVLNRLPMTEGVQIIEAEGKTYKVDKGYEVPVWRLDKKNLNNRIYTESLGKAVVKNNSMTFALADHPADEGSVLKIVAVGKNPHIREGILYADCYFVDDVFAKKVENIIKLGMGLGLSSSSYGDVDDNGNVLLEGFEIERYFDFVLNPSYEVEITAETIKEEAVIEESSEPTKIKEEENIKMSTSYNAIEIKNFSKGFKEYFEKVEATTSSDEKRKIIEDILDYAEGVDHEVAVSSINKANAILESLTEEDIKVRDLKEKQKDELLEFYKEDNKRLKEDNKVKRIETRKVKKPLKVEAVNREEEKVVKLKEKQSKDLVDFYKKDNENMREKTIDVERLQKKFAIAESMLDSFKARELKMKEMYRELQGRDNGKVTAKMYNESLSMSESLEVEIEELKSANLILKKEVNELRENISNKEDEFVLEKTEILKEKQRYDVIKAKEELVEQEEQDRFDALQEEQDEIDSHFKNTEEIQDYYQDLLYENSNVKKIKDEILKCKTIIEAQKTFINLKDLINETHLPYSEGTRLEETELQKKNVRNPVTGNLSRKGWV